MNIRDNSGRTVLFFAYRRDSVKCIELLLKAGADVNIENEWGKTLFSAVIEGSPQRTDLLLKAAADVNIRDEDGRTALFYAVSRGCTDLLLKAGADVNIKDKYSRTALFYAAENGCVQCTDLLLKAGADVNHRDKDGKTALFDAVRKGSSECIELLLKAGADANFKDECSELLFFANQCTSAQLLKMLLCQGVKVNHGMNTITWILKYRYHPRKEEIMMLLLAAGELIDETQVERIPDHLKPSAEISLMNICRETIRKHLLQMSDVNLFIRVPRLGLPAALQSYLLYDQTLDDDNQKADHVNIGR